MSLGEWRPLHDRDLWHSRDSGVAMLAAWSDTDGPMMCTVL